MNKPELITRVAELSGEKKNKVENIFEAILHTLEEAATRGEKVNIMGYFTQEVKDVAERVGRNPKTGEQVITPAHKKVVMKAKKALQDAVEGL